MRRVLSIKTSSDTHTDSNTNTHGNTHTYTNTTMLRSRIRKLFCSASPESLLKIQVSLVKLSF